MESKKDDEINVDFSKVKNFFKSKEVDSQKKETVEIKDRDDEISIDLGKLKNLFKGEKIRQEVTATKTTHGTKVIEEVKIDLKDKDDDEISFDFKKIKNVFRQEEEKEDDFTIDWGKFAGFFRKYGIIFIALIPIILSIYVRMQAGFLPVTDDWATNSVINAIQSQIKGQINSQYPNLPEANKNALVQTELNRFLNQNKEQIDQQIAQTSQYFKSFFQKDDGKNYMPDIDPYYWLRYAGNIVEHGYPGDVVKDGVQYDDHQLAPIGRPVAKDMFHAHFIAYFWKFSHFFIPTLSLERAVMYTPVFVSALCVLLVFLLARRIAGNTAGFFAGAMMAINSAFLGRTLFGHSDTDVWVVLFPLLITLLFVDSLKSDSMKKLLAYTVLAGFFTGLFTYAWTGWWYIFDFLLATVAVTFLYLVAIHFQEIRRKPRFIWDNYEIRSTLIFGMLYFISTLAFVVVFSGWSAFVSSFLGPLSFPSIKAPTIGTSAWPNVLTTVAELNEGSINAAVNSIGGRLFFFISLTGLLFAVNRKGGLRKFDYLYIIAGIVFYGLYFLFKGSSDSVFMLAIWIMAPVLVWILISVRRKNLDYDFKLSLLLSLWVIATVFSSLKGVRFTLLLAPAFSVAFGVALGKIYVLLSDWFSRELKINKKLASVILLLILLSIYIKPTIASAKGAGSDIPLVNDAWYSVLTKIKDSSKENAIITSWWDFGHHFKAIADRPVTFDGTTQTAPPAHWVGKLLMSDDEKEAVGILRMLDCGSNSGFSTINKIENDFHKSMRILKELIVLSKDGAQKKLRSLGYTNEQAEKVLAYTHCSPPEAFFIASEDMIGKSGVWSHFGSWNFERADIWQNVRGKDLETAVKYMMDKFNYTRERAENTYYEVQSISSDSEANTWISPWPGYGGEVDCPRQGGVFVCSNGFIINMTSMDVYGLTQQGISRPKVAAFAIKDGMIKKEYNGTTVDFGATIIPESNDNVKTIMSSKELAGSMFTRMFYLNGHGLRYFKLFDHQSGLTGTDIYTYKVDWQGSNTTIIEQYAAAFQNITSEMR